jgi:hypothetical protein
VHLACARLDKGEPVGLLRETDQPYFDAYLAARAAWFDATWTAIEQPYYSRLGFAGTPDRLGQFQGHDVVVDIKTGQPAKWHGIQLAAYDLLVPRALRRQRWAIYLTAAGVPLIRHYDDPRDYARFLHALATMKEDHDDDPTCAGGTGAPESASH